MTAQISACIVSWNDADALERCLAALPRAAGGAALQTIVVDNGSTDHTSHVLAAHPDVEVVRNRSNRGLTPGRNQAAERAEGRFIVMLDADTRPRPGSLTTLASYLEDHLQVGLVGPKLLDPDGSLQLSCRTFPPALLPFLRRPPLQRWFEHSSTVDRHLMRGFDHREPRPVDWVLGACQLYRAELFDRLGGYDQQIFSHGGEDTDWCLRVWQAGLEVHYVPAAEVIHDYGHFTRHNPFSKQAFRALTDFYYLLWKHRHLRRRSLAGP